MYQTVRGKAESIIIPSFVICCVLHVTCYNNSLMSFVCFNCQKGSIRGTQHRHHPGVAGRQHLRKAPRTPKLFVPNLHNAFVLINEGYQQVLLCTKCRRLLKKQGRIKTWTKPAAVLVKKVEKAVKPQVMPEAVKVTKPGKKVIAEEKPKTVKKETVRKARSVKAPEEKKPTISVEELVGKKS